jgi:hypothetical protein
MSQFAPVIVLFVLSPVVAEFLFGATPVSRLGSLVVVAPLYGGGVVLIRELARRRGFGWGRIALLGAAYGIVEEGLAIQSMFNPELFNAGILGGRALGVNWIWTEWTVGYHVVWGISIPILLAELLFHDRRDQPWLGRWGLVVAGLLYAFGAVALGMIFRHAVAPTFRAPLILNAAAVLVVGGLVALAFRWPTARAVARTPRPVRTVPSPLLVGLMTLVSGVAWFTLLNLPHALRTDRFVLVPFLLGLLLVAGVIALLRSWSAADRAWTDLHKLAMIIGALVPSTLFGFFFVTSGNRVDQLTQGGASVAALALLAFLAGCLRNRLATKAEAGWGRLDLS